MPELHAPRVFISYAWESDEYRSWVEALAVRLLHDGIDVRLDRWHARSGSIPDFMSSEIRQADAILLLCSPGYRTKVHARQDQAIESGVGWEAALITGAWFAGVARKVVVALAAGTWAEAAPDFLLGNLRHDISTPQAFENGYRGVLQALFDIRPALPAPGKRPPDIGIVLPPPLEVREGQWQGGETQPAIPVDDGPRVEIAIRPAADGQWTVALASDGGPAATGSFRFDPEPLSQPASDLAAIDANNCKAEQIRNLGCELWTRLLEAPELQAKWSEAARVLRQHRHFTLKLRLDIPRQLEKLPWEALYDYDAMALATSPRISLVRSSREPAPGEPLPPARGPLRFLVVIPAASGLATSGEWERIQESVRNARGSVELTALDGCVTIGRLADVLRRDWDVVHFIGHGRLTGEGQTQLRFNLAGDDPTAEDWIPELLFAQQFRQQVPRLVLLNCCHAGSSRAEGFGHLGSSLVKAGVPAVLVMRYEIRDSVAAEFAAVFYRELLTGERAGRVDLATQEGRAAIERTFRDPARVRSYVTPVLYLKPQCEQLFAIRPAKAPAAVVELPPGRQPNAKIPAKLLHAISKNSCLPIIGPGILAAGIDRQGAAAPPGPVALAQELARLTAFPEAERLTPLADSSGGWLTPLLLERICQHFESEAPGDRGDLNDYIENSYSRFQPGPLLRALAAWPAPGMIYTFVDGLLEAALRDAHTRDLKVVQVEDILEKATSPANDELVLVHLRGAWRAAKAGDSRMILTEEDADPILEGMPAIAAFVSDLMNKVSGCTLLFVGISPRDPLVRALARQILRQSVAQNRGTAFFVATRLQKADAAYWKQFQKLEILEIDEESLILDLSAHGSVKRNAH